MMYSALAELACNIVMYSALLSDYFYFPPFPEDAIISRHFQNEAKLTLLQWGMFLDIKNIPAPADSGEKR